MLRGKTKIIPCDHVVFFKEKIHRLCAVTCKFCKIMHNLTVKFSGDSKRERKKKKKKHTERFSVVLLVVVVTLDFSDESPVNP
jgi:hypothetical protein